jgi:hypothetical protein
MRWPPWKRAPDVHTPDHTAADPEQALRDSQQAIRDTAIDLDQAQHALEEMRGHTASIRVERQRNHFAPLLAELMRRR